MVAALFESETKLASSMGKKMSAKMFFSQQVGKVSVKGLTKCFFGKKHAGAGVRLREAGLQDPSLMAHDFYASLQLTPPSKV